MIRDRLVTLATSTVRAVARHWFMRGFACSGSALHGETGGRARAESLLSAEFDRQCGERHRS